MLQEEPLPLYRRQKLGVGENTNQRTLRIWFVHQVDGGGGSRPNGGRGIEMSSEEAAMHEASEQETNRAQ